MIREYFTYLRQKFKKYNDLSKTKETLHVVESMVKVERFLTYEKYRYKKWNLLHLFSMLIKILSYG
jgi:hypothetical protein